MRSPLSGHARAEVVALPALGHLSEGVVVEGWPSPGVRGHLLRVTADVVLMPAAVQRVDGIELERTRRLSRNSPAREKMTRALSPSTSDGRPRLRDALQLLQDTDALLERAQPGGPDRPWPFGQGRSKPPQVVKAAKFSSSSR